MVITACWLKTEKSINICAKCLLSKTSNQFLKLQASEEREDCFANGNVWKLLVLPRLTSNDMSI